MSARVQLPPAYDEAHAAPGTPRPGYTEILRALGGRDLAALREEVRCAIARQGATFGGAPFPTDPVPRVIPAAEWDALAAGLEQRVRALNAFLADAYGEQRVVEAGIVDAAVIEEAEGFEPELRGRLPAGPAAIGVAGLDVVRGADGGLRVLEDNCRAPSGFTYAMAVRRALDEVLGDDVLPERRDAPEALGQLVRRTLRDAAPPGTRGEPLAVVLTEGPEAPARWEHERLAALAGARVVTLDDLAHRGRRLVVRAPGGGVEEVDVVLRRLDDDRLRDAEGRPTPAARLLLEPWLAGRVGLVNAFGTGLADDKLVHAHVEELVRFHLGEEPLVRSVPTLDLRRPEALQAVLDDLRLFVVKPRWGFGGRGVVVCAHARDDTLAQLRDELLEAPGRWVAQPTVTLSRHPTVVDGGRLEPRHVDLRPFVFCGRGWASTLPGALTRVAFGEGALVVNSSQDGGGKDTWIVER